MSGAVASTAIARMPCGDRTFAASSAHNMNANITTYSVRNASVRSQRDASYDSKNHATTRNSVPR